MKFSFRILVTLLLSSHLFPQQIFESQFIPFDGEQWDHFGRSVAHSDSFIFIGSSSDDNYSGSVYVYKNENNNWSFQKKLLASDRQEFDRFGNELILNGNKLFIGALSKKVNSINSGVVYLFKYSNGDWIEKQKIVPPVLQYEGGFSESISSYENYLLVGALRYDNVYEYAGKAFLYEEVDSSYSFIQELIPSDPKYLANFGSAVSIHDNFIIIGSWYDSTSSGFASGSVYLFIKQDSLWVEVNKYLPDSNSVNLAYGSSIAFDDKYVFIGAIGNVSYVGPGSVYIYERNLLGMDLIQTINSGEGYNYDSFGAPLALKGDSVLIGAFTDTTAGEITGTAYLFGNNTETWVKLRKFNPSDKENANWYGVSLSIHNSKILIGAPETKVNGEHIGKAYLYTDYPVFVEEEFYTNEDITFSISHNYPNPFNAATRIHYIIKIRQPVSLKVYDILGNEVATLVNEELPEGEYEVEFNGNELASGIYFYQIKAGNFILTKKAVLLK